MVNQYHISVGVASVPARKKNLIRVVGSLVGQSDEIYVALNNYPEIPQELLGDDRIKPILCDNRIADGYKFIGVDSTDGVYLSADDDLLYPKGYAQRCVEAIDRYHCIVTFHGKRYDRKPIISYHKSFSTNIRCLGSLAGDTPVHVGGTGVMAFHTKDFPLSLSDIKSPFMADIWVAKRAHELGVKIMALAHKSDYFQYLGTADAPIWGKRKGNPEETALLKSFIK